MATGKQRSPNCADRVINHLDIFQDSLIEKIQHSTDAKIPTEQKRIWINLQIAGVCLLLFGFFIQTKINTLNENKKSGEDIKYQFDNNRTLIAIKEFNNNISNLRIEYSKETMLEYPLHMNILTNIEEAIKSQLDINEQMINIIPNGFKKNNIAFDKNDALLKNAAWREKVEEYLSNIRKRSNLGQNANDLYLFYTDWSFNFPYFLERKNLVSHYVKSVENEATFWTNVYNFLYLIGTCLVSANLIKERLFFKSDKNNKQSKKQQRHSTSNG